MIPHAMASLTVDGDQLVVRLSAWERAAAFHGDIRLPLAAFRSVAIEPRPWDALRGIRAPASRA
jgi:hypothetical protein